MFKRILAASAMAAALALPMMAANASERVRVVVTHVVPVYPAHVVSHRAAYFRPYVPHAAYWHDCRVTKRHVHRDHRAHGRWYVHNEHWRRYR